MQVNDDNENEDGAVEGLVDLGEANPYQGAPIHREEEFLNSKLVNSEKFDKSLIWNPFQTCSDAYATLELESFVNTKVNGTFQLARGGNICRVVCRGDVGRIKWNKALNKHQPISNGHDAYRRMETQRVHPLWCQLEQTHVWMRTLATLWNRMQSRYCGMGEISRTIGGKEW